MQRDNGILVRTRSDRPDGLEITENELWILSYYRESELAGALVMGRLAQGTDDDELRVRLTEHCAEEAEHAWLWTETILAVGGAPLRIRETYQSRLYAEVGPPKSVLEVLALTQVFERRVLRHFRDHLRQPDVHPTVAATLRRMIADEAGHIGWIKKRLDRHAREDGEAVVAETLRRLTEVDRKVYAELIDHRDRFSEVVDPAHRPAPSTNGTGPSAAANGKGPGRPAAAVEREIQRIAARALGVPPAELDSRAPLGTLGVESLRLLVLISEVEETFQIELSPADAEGLFSLEDLIETVTERSAPCDSRSPVGS